MHSIHYSVWKSEKLSLTEKIFREINSLVTFFSKIDTFTKFLPKKHEKISNCLLQASKNFSRFCVKSLALYLGSVKCQLISCQREIKSK